MSVTLLQFSGFWKCRDIEKISVVFLWLTVVSFQIQRIRILTQVLPPATTLHYQPETPLFSLSDRTGFYIHRRDSKFTWIVYTTFEKKYVHSYFLFLSSLFHQLPHYYLGSRGGFFHPLKPIPTWFDSDTFHPCSVCGGQLTKGFHLDATRTYQSPQDKESQ